MMILPVFTKYDTKAISAEKSARTIVVTDIPMYAKADPIKAAFRKYGTIVDFHMYTPFKSKFQAAEIIFSSQQAVNIFEDKWSIFVMGECLRTRPKNFTKEQIEARSQHAAILHDLPPNTNASKLIHIMSNTNAKAIGIPRTLSTYRPRPWAHFFFATQEARDSAMELSVAVNNKPVRWTLPDKNKPLCLRCSFPNYKMSECDALRLHGRTPTVTAIIIVPLLP